MSSHHIVRDNQEPALYIDAPITNFEWIGQLLEWSPILIVNAVYLDWIDMYDLKPDVILFEKPISAELKSELQKKWFPLEIHEKSDADELVQLLKNKNQLCLNWYCTEETIDERSKFILSNQLQFNLVTSKQKIFPVYSNSFKKWLNKGQKFEFIFLQEDTQVSFQNRKVITSDSFVSDETKLVNFESNKPYFFSEFFI